MSESSSLTVDVNVVLEILAKREKYDFCISVLNSYKSLFLSPTSVHIIYYFGKKYGLSKNGLSKFLSDYQILSFDHSVYLQALKISKNADVEDALQISSSLASGVNTFFTLDLEMIKLYKNYINFVVLE